MTRADKLIIKLVTEQVINVHDEDKSKSLEAIYNDIVTANGYRKDYKKEVFENIRGKRPDLFNTSNEVSSKPSQKPPQIQPQKPYTNSSTSQNKPVMVQMLPQKSSAISSTSQNKPVMVQKPPQKPPQIQPQKPYVNSSTSQNKPVMVQMLPQKLSDEEKNVVKNLIDILNKNPNVDKNDWDNMYMMVAENYVQLRNKRESIKERIYKEYLKQCSVATTDDAVISKLVDICKDKIKDGYTDTKIEEIITEQYLGNKSLLAKDWSEFDWDNKEGKIVTTVLNRLKLSTPIKMIKTRKTIKYGDKEIILPTVIHNRPVNRDTYKVMVENNQLDDMNRGWCSFYSRLMMLCIYYQTLSKSELDDIRKTRNEYDDYRLLNIAKEYVEATDEQTMENKVNEFARIVLNRGFSSSLISEQPEASIYVDYSQIALIFSTGISLPTRLCTYS